jgi:hypothetical protein
LHALGLLPVAQGGVVEGEMGFAHWDALAVRFRVRNLLFINNGLIWIFGINGRPGFSPASGVVAGVNPGLRFGGTTAPNARSCPWHEQPPAAPTGGGLAPTLGRGLFFVGIGNLKPTPKEIRKRLKLI